MKAFFKMLGPIALLALAAGLQMTGALLYFHAVPDFFLVTAYILITFGIYLFNRFTDCEDAFNCPEQRRIFQDKLRFALIPIFMMVISVLMLSAVHRLCIWHIILVAAGILYSLKLIPKWKTGSLCFIRMKEILFVKNLSVSLLWGIMPFAIAGSQPASAAPETADLTVVVLAFCMTTLINTTTCDVRDADGDRQVGIVTVATKFGEQRIGLYLLGIGLIAAVAVVGSYIAGTINLPVCILFVGTTAWTALVSLPTYLNKQQIPRMISEPLIDTQQLVCGAALIMLACG